MWASGLSCRRGKRAHQCRPRRRDGDPAEAIAIGGRRTLSRPYESRAAFSRPLRLGSAARRSDLSASSLPLSGAEGGHR